MQLYLVWFGMVWLGNFKKKTVNQYSFGGKRCSKLYLILYIIIATLFGLVCYDMVPFMIFSIRYNFEHLLPAKLY